jgi:uncharacterized membrane protein
LELELSAVELGERNHLLPCNKVTGYYVDSYSVSFLWLISIHYVLFFFFLGQKETNKNKNKTTTYKQQTENKKKQPEKGEQTEESWRFKVTQTNTNNKGRDEMRMLPLKTLLET